MSDRLHQRRVDGRHDARASAWLILAVGLVAIVAALAFRFQVASEHHAAPLEEQLRGSADDAAATLPEVLRRTPKARQPALLTRYADDPSPGLRYAAVDALGDLKLPETAGVIERAFADNSSQVRQRAVEVLHTVAPERGVRLLRAALQDDDRWVRESAIMQLLLAVRKHKEYFPPIAASVVAALDPSDEVVCRSGVHLLARETGKPWRLRAGMPRAEQDRVVAQWKRWWDAERKRYLNRADLVLPEPIQPSRQDPAPEFRIRCLDGSVRTLDSQRGRLTLLHFWGTWCAACRQEMADLARLDRTYRGKGLDILGLALAESDTRRVTDFAQRVGVSFPLAHAPAEVTTAYGHIHEVPVSVLIDRRGMIRYRWDGERDYQTFERAVKRLLVP